MDKVSVVGDKNLAQGAATGSKLRTAALSDAQLVAPVS